MICGQCGDRVRYLYEDGRLDIEGTGPMWDFVLDTDSERGSPCYETPWWMLQVVDVTVHSGVTRVGNGAFHRTSELRAVWIPETVTEIGTEAFALSGLKYAILSNSLQRIESHAFFGCGDLEQLLLPDNVHLGAYSFAQTGLRWLRFGGRLASAGSLAFGFNSLLTEVDLPQCGALDSGLFYRCGISRADLSESELENLPDFMFSGCENLFDVRFPPRVRSLGKGSFLNTGLLDLVLPETVEAFSPVDVICSDSLKCIVFLGKKAPRCAVHAAFCREDLELVIREDAEGFDVMPWSGQPIVRMTETELERISKQ